MFEDQIRRCMKSERENYLILQDQTDEQLEDIVEQSYELFQNLMRH